MPVLLLLLLLPEFAVVFKVPWRSVELVIAASIDVAGPRMAGGEVRIIHIAVVVVVVAVVRVLAVVKARVGFGVKRCL
jgi:hypothetical protein